MKQFFLVKDESAASIYIDKNSVDAKGLFLMAETFAEDVKTVTGVSPKVVSEEKEGPMIVVGAVGACDVIDRMAEEGKLDISDVVGKREVFKIAFVEDKLIVTGSERIAPLFGLFEISAEMGVSPWIYWADVIPKKRKEITFDESICRTSKEPSVKYRGFFMNDEWPCLGNYVMNTFGDFNAEFYRKVFELLLRLKGNYFWPAMWSASFPLDGGNGNPLGNMELSDALGITACFSHHEPMTRASEEWDKVKSERNGEGYGADWNYNTNSDGLYKYWSDGLERDKHLKNMIVIGMRGERDSFMLGPDSTIQENVDLLEKIITDQKQIIKDKHCEDMPQMLALYKEVEDYYYGSKDSKGLCELDLLDDVILMLADDNFGNVRRLPTKENRNRKAGWGLYYHFDYHGAPISYEWVSSMPLQKTWEQVSMAYDYGIRDLWIVNVGDLRPQELPLSYFMSLAYDFETWGTDHINQTEKFLQQWVEQQFGASVSDEKVKADIADVLFGYARMHGNRKPEATFPETYHVTHFNEAKRKLKEFDALAKKAENIKSVIPETAMDAFYSLVYFPAVAGANLQKANIYAALNQWYAENGAKAAVEYKEKVNQCIEIDKEMTDYYHNVMANGKWNGMMLSKHFCFEDWNDEGSHYPITVDVSVPSGRRMLVHVENQDIMLSEATTSLPEFVNVTDSSYTVEIVNGATEEFDYTASTDVDWVVLSKTSGHVNSADTINVRVDFTKIHKDSHAVITIKGADAEVTVLVSAKVVDTSTLPENTFIGTDGIISMEAEHFAKAESFGIYEWKKIDNYGKTLSSMKVYPTTENFDRIGEAPKLTYRVWIDEEAEYTLQTIVAPTNSLEDGRKMRFAISVDNGEWNEVDTLGDNYFIGAGFGGTPWGDGVLNNCHTAEISIKLQKGVHELTLCAVDAGLVLQKLVLYKDELAESYFGPIESGRV